MEDKKVLFRITNLKQYFPLSKKGMYVKANDGISVDIYQGETFGLVGESGCGKSTFGRTILELYKQTDGRTMYYGRTIEELAPEYVRETIKDFPKLKEKLAKLRENEKEAQEAFDNAKPEDQGEKYDDLLKAKHAANPNSKTSSASSAGSTRWIISSPFRTPIWRSRNCPSN